jgi:mono/diheme cytochrome c family protein
MTIALRSRQLAAIGGVSMLLFSLWLWLGCPELKASSWGQAPCSPPPCHDGFVHDGWGPGGSYIENLGGSWYWMRSPEQEKATLASFFNRYCIRCHGGDGRGIWDIPGIPDFTNARWQAYRSDAQIARIIIEGRGAVMPAFRGTLTLEEAWAMARYLRSFAPGSEVSRPDLSTPGKEQNKSPKAEAQQPKH